MSDNPTLEALLQSSSSEDESLDEREALDEREDNNTAAMSLAAPAASASASAVAVVHERSHESSPYNLDLERILQDSGESCSNKLNDSQ